jgi:hypothetical protein
MADQDQPNPASDMEKAEGDRPSEWGEGTSEGAGISNRPNADEAKNQQQLPPRGEAKPGAHAG